MGKHFKVHKCTSIHKTEIQNDVCDKQQCTFQYLRSTLPTERKSARYKSFGKYDRDTFY